MSKTAAAYERACDDWDDLNPAQVAELLDERGLSFQEFTQWWLDRKTRPSAELTAFYDYADAALGQVWRETRRDSYVDDDADRAFEEAREKEG